MKMTDKSTVKFAPGYGTLFTDCWTNRNHLLFGDTPESKRKTNGFRFEAKVRETCEACFELPKARRQHTYFTPLLKTHSETLTMWLTQAKQTPQEHRKAILKGTTPHAVFPSPVTFQNLVSHRASPTPQSSDIGGSATRVRLRVVDLEI